MILKAWPNYVDLGESFILLNRADSKEIGIDKSVRACLKYKKGSILTSAIIVEEEITPRGYAEIPIKMLEKLGIAQEEKIEVTHTDPPSSMDIIRKKMDGKRLTEDEIKTVINDVSSLRLSNFEIASWIAALHIKGMDMDEISYMVKAIANDGKITKFDRKPVFDFHSVGGVPGNKITPIVVSIVAAAGLMLPKTSTRAISSACGTIDFVELFCNPMLTTEEIKNVAEKTGGCLAWGGSIDVAPADNIIINVEHYMNANPRAQMMASIMCKKLAISSTRLLIDIPVGAGTKIANMDIGKDYAKGFIEIGKRVGIQVECALTYAEQPVGNAIGPKLEARECLRVLEGDPDPPSVVEKACDMAGIILEMGGIENGFEKASEILSSGKALEKFREIIKAQGGNENIKSSDLEPGKYKCEIKSSKNGFIRKVNNDAFVKIAKAAGAPSDKGAGLIVVKKKGQKIDRNDVLFEIYADSESKCNHAEKLANELSPFVIESMLIERLS